MELKKEYIEKFVIQKSEFIVYANTTHTTQEANSYIESVRERNPNATHVCSAYMLGESNQLQKYNDDHEPKSTAGLPILENIKFSGLQNLTVCVVRYFGGIKLGASGLIRAYGGSTNTALKNAEKVELVTVYQYQVTYDYSYTNALSYYLEHETIQPSFEYGEEITCTFFVKKDISDTIKEKTSGKITPVFIKNSYIMIDAE